MTADKPTTHAQYVRWARKHRPRVEGSTIGWHGLYTVCAGVIIAVLVAIGIALLVAVNR